MLLLFGSAEDIPDQVNWWSKFALCLVRHMVSTGVLRDTIRPQVTLGDLLDLSKR